MAKLVAEPRFISFVYNRYNYMASYTQSTLSDRIIFSVSYISAEANDNGICQISHPLEAQPGSLHWVCESKDVPTDFVEILCEAIEKHMAGVI
jgi:hypothetical protein